MDQDDKLKKEEDRLMRVMHRGGSKANLAAPKPAAAPKPEPVAHASASSQEEPAWKRKQREEREATERRLAEEKQRKDQQPKAVRVSPREAPAQTSSVSQGVATSDEVMSYEEREKQRRDEWKKRTNPYEWAMEDPDRRLHMLPDLLAAKERDEAKLSGRGAEATAHTPLEETQPERKAAPVAQPERKPAPVHSTSESDELLSSLADAETNAKKATFLVNMDVVQESMRGNTFDFRTLASLVRELQSLAPQVTQAHPDKEEASKAFLTDPTRELLLKAKYYKDDHDAQKQQELIECMQQWSEGARNLLE